MKNIFAIILAILCGFSVTSAYAVSVPTIHQVYIAAHSGHLRQAQQMMGQVLAAHPNSGKAHFVLAEILTAEQQFAQASQELNTARRLEPGLPFEKPQAVTSLQARIQNGLAHGGSREPGGRRTGSGISRVVVALFVLCLILVVVIVRAMRRPQPMPMGYPGPMRPTNLQNNMPGNMTNGPFTPMTPYGGGFMSNLKTGLGIGAGMAAGEALVDHFIDGNRTGVGPVMQDQMTSAMNEPIDTDNLGGNDFGMNDDSSWSDDTSMGGDDFSDMDSGGDDWN